MGEMNFFKLEDFFQEEDTNDEVIETEVTPIEYSYFNKICININNMTNSSINLGNIRSGPSASNNRGSTPGTAPTTSRPTTSRPPITRPTPKRSLRKRKYKRNKHQTATLKITFPGMIQKKDDQK